MHKVDCSACSDYTSLQCHMILQKSFIIIFLFLLLFYIWWFAFNISYYYQRWKQWCLLFVESIMFFGQDSFIIRKFNLKIKFKIEIFCNKYFSHFCILAEYKY